MRQTRYFEATARENRRTNKEIDFTISTLDKVSLHWITYIQQLSLSKQESEQECCQAVAEDPDDILCLVELAKKTRDNLELCKEEICDIIDLLRRRRFMHKKL